MDKNISNICIAGLAHPDLDTRFTNLADSLVKDGFNVSLLGFHFRDENFQTIKLNNKKVYKLAKGKLNFVFYFKFIFYSLFNLLKGKTDLFFAEDVYILPLVFLAAKIKKARVVYNSREIYANLAGLRNKKLTQKFIAAVENYFIRKVDFVLTTGEMDTDLIKENFSLDNVLTIRNLPKKQTPRKAFDFRGELNIPADKKLLLYQGVVLEGRGIEPILKAMQILNDFVFIILGEGEFAERFRQLSIRLGVRERVFFFGAVEQSELINFTAGADLGLSLIENISLSYYYALPNKLFEYIMAGLPALVSDLPQMRKIVENYQVGAIVGESLKPEKIAEKILNFFADKNYAGRIKNNCKIASAELNWENEYKKLKKIIG